MGLAGKASALAGKGGVPRQDDGLHHPRQHHQPVAARSWGTGPASGGQSVSTTSGSAGLPSAARSDPSNAPTPDASVSATPASDSTLFRLHHHDIDDDDAGSQQGGGKKKKRAARTVGTDKGGRGLRQFSMKVCEKVESKGRTTYNEVADELVAEFADPSSSFAGQDQQQQYDEKNIRRRVYDALNVLMAMDIISKDKKEIRWKGLPRTSLSDIEELTAERSCLRNRIDKKAAFFRELEEQYVGLQNLIQRNEQLYDSGNAPDGGVDLPFILVQTRPHATVEVEISEDMQLVHFDFNSTPFELHDDAYVLKAMNLSQLSGAEGEQDSVANGGNNPGKDTASQNHMSNPPRPSPMGKPSASHPVPGILKGRLKQ